VVLESGHLREPWAAQQTATKKKKLANLLEAPTLPKAFIPRAVDLRHAAHLLRDPTEESILDKVNGVSSHDCEELLLGTGLFCWVSTRGT
jgi:hypothetical protein